MSCVSDQLQLEDDPLVKTVWVVPSLSVTNFNMSIVTCDRKVHVLLNVLCTIYLPEQPAQKLCIH